MRGEQFIEVARELADGGKEAHWRSSASRAYYAAFHTAREAITQHDIVIPETAAGHQRVQDCLAASGNGLLETANTYLGTLHNNRLKADYRLTTAMVRWPKTARAMAVLAEDFVKHVHRSPLMQGNAAPVVSRMNEYLARRAAADT